MPGGNPIPAPIAFNQATVARGDTLALKEITLCIEQGENVAMIGPNGSGKSTLMKTITRECCPLSDHPTNLFSVPVEVLERNGRYFMLS